MKAFVNIGFVFLMLAIAVNTLAQRPVWHIAMTNKLGVGYRGYITKTITDKENSSYTVYHYKDSTNLNDFKVIGQDTNALVYKLDVNGKHLWQTNFSADGIRIIDIEVDENLNIYILLMVNNSITYVESSAGVSVLNTASINLVKMLPNGNVSWCKQVKGSNNKSYDGNYIYSDMVLDMDNNIHLFTCYKDSVSIDDSVVYFPDNIMTTAGFKVTTNGIVVKAKNIVTGVNSSFFGALIRKMGINEATGRIYVLLAGIRSNNFIDNVEINTTNTTHILAEFNSDMELEHYINLNPQTQNTDFLSCAPLANGDYIIGGHSLGNVTHTIIDSTINVTEFDRPFFARISSSGELIWLHSYLVERALIDFVEEVILSPDKKYVYVQFFLGEGDRMDLDGHMIDDIRGTWILAKYDVDGNYVWHLTSNYGGSTHLRQTLAVDSAGAVYFSEQTQRDFTLGCYVNTFFSKEDEVLFKISEKDDLIADFNICPGASETICPALEGQSIYWSTGERTQAITIKDSGTYTVRVNYKSCVYIDTFHVGYTDGSIDVSLGPDTALCSDEYVITANNYVEEYLWNTGDTTISITVNQTNEYSVRVKNKGCVGYDTINVTLKNIPVLVDIGSDTFICEGTSTQLNAQTNATSYLWNTNADNKTITVNKEGEYTVIVDSMGCKGYDTINVTSIPYPKPYLGQDTSICFERGSITLTAGIGDNYLWNTGETSPEIIVTKHGEYTVTVTNNGVCSSTDELVISNGCISTLYTPNAFSPNSNSFENRVFKPVGNGIIVITLSIYNRWGEMIHYQEGPNAQWDGTYKGTPVMQGRYMYVITYRAKTDSPDKFAIDTESGYLTLLR